MKKPICMGFWAVQVTRQMDLIKWGKDGDTLEPYPTFREAKSQLKYIKKQETEDCRYYFLKVFDTGHLVTYDYE